VSSPQQAVVVDTNVLFSALLTGQSSFSEVLLRSGHRFYVCELVLVELFKRKDKIVKASHLSEDDIVRVYQTLLKQVTLFKENLIAPENRMAAHAMCHDIDETWLLPWSWMLSCGPETSTSRTVSDGKASIASSSRESSALARMPCPPDWQSA